MTAFVDPTRETFDAFKALPRDEPIAMLNLIALRTRAAYADGFAGAADRSGAEAYAEYGRVSGPIFLRVGGAIAWRADPKAVLIGPPDENWDFAFVASYPSAGAFLEMISDAAYQGDAVPHRQAAVATSRLIRCAPTSAGGNFAAK